MKGAPIVHQQPNVNPWITYQLRQAHKKNNCINGILTGDPGSGKSFAMLSMAEAICKARGEEFKIEGNLFFKAADMMREIKRYYEQPGSKKGKLWLFDEAGIDANNLNFHDQINRGLNAFFQTARHRNYIFWMTVPHFGFVSKGVRNLMTSHFQANGWIPKENLTKIVPRVLQYNGNNDKLYRKRILIKDLNGNMGYCNEIHLPIPSKKLVKEYEKLKKEFTGDLFADIANKIEAQEQEKESKAMGAELTDKQAEIVELLKRDRTPDMIATIKNITPSSVRASMSLIKKKGFKIKKHTDDAGHVTYDIIEPDI